MKLNQIVLTILIIGLGPSLLFQSCKKKDDSFDSVQVSGVEEKLVGYWNVIELEAIGDIDVSGVKFQTVATNKDQPKGYYQLFKEPNLYYYNLETKLEMKALGGSISQDYDYNDRDGGTWEVAANEHSVIFRGNQGIDQEVFFTQYDSSDFQIMRIAIPLDTEVGGYNYEGTVFIKMAKIN